MRFDRMSCAVMSSKTLVLVALCEEERISAIPRSTHSMHAFNSVFGIP